MREEDIWTIIPVKFHGRPPPDAPGSGRRSGDGGHRESPVFSWFSGHFPATSGHPIAPFHHFGPPELIFVVPFCRLRTVWELQRKRNRPEVRSGFFGHHSDCWTKVMVPMSSWSLGLSIDMWFVNFERRLVSFPFLGCLGKLPRSRD